MTSRLAAAVMIAGALLTSSASADGGKDPANPLITDRGQFRPLILITPNETQPAYRELRQQLEASRDAFEARDMLLYTIEGDHGTRLGQDMTPYETQALLQALDIDPANGVTTVLVGKDGGKKVQQRGHVSLQQIYDTIDRMPMRRREAE
ncbi:DUF4174 domain-containing protein [Salinicola avicenniae]|uniref:DUF4174 domain-containing protein n=1 Tax=Salinicola avicenniae TaxID=2916836 RepID=UPI0020730727|nr:MULTISPECIES: DUF4174 domain-containing protein [unclassified Salinicola]